MSDSKHLTSLPDSYAEPKCCANCKYSTFIGKTIYLGCGKMTDSPADIDGWSVNVQFRNVLPFAVCDEHEPC